MLSRTSKTYAKTMTNRQRSQVEGIKILFASKYFIFSQSIENGHFSQNSKEGTKGNFSKIADFFVEVRKAKKLGNTSRLMAEKVWIESLTILDLRYAKNRLKKIPIRQEITFFF